MVYPIKAKLGPYYPIYYNCTTRYSASGTFKEEEKDARVFRYPLDIEASFIYMLQILPWMHMLYFSKVIISHSYSLPDWLLLITTADQTRIFWTPCRSLYFVDMACSLTTCYPLIWLHAPIPCLCTSSPIPVQLPIFNLTSCSFTIWLHALFPF